MSGVQNMIFKKNFINPKDIIEQDFSFAAYPETQTHLLIIFALLGCKLKTDLFMITFMELMAMYQSDESQTAH